jgi:putative tricarboxylic transport membrane protein
MDVILSAVTSGLSQLMTPIYLAYLFGGVLLGLVIGWLPGLGGISGMSIMLPFLFGMDPVGALAAMIGMSSVTSTSDTFPSVLIGVPGSAGSQATIVDGFQMTQQGQGARALSAAFTASLLGGICGALCLSLSVIVARPILLQIGFGEQLILIFIALTCVGVLTGSSALKGLVSCGLGLLIGTIGVVDVTAQNRMTLGTEYLIDGVSLVVLALGLFAIPEITDVLRRRDHISAEAPSKSGTLQGIKDVLKNKWLVVRCSFIGTAVGALPGLGGSIIDWLAYAHTVQSTKDKEKFGKGDVRGVIGPESANNAKEGGALIPTLFLGIPGSGTMALLMSGLVIIGITPGRSLVTNHLDLIYLCVWSIAIANILGALICLAFSKPISKVTHIRFSLVAPMVLSLIFFAAFQATRSWGDFVMLLVAGVLGIYMRRFGWSRPALLIGFVLSKSLEDAVYRTIQIYGFDFLLRPFALALTIFSIGFVVFMIKTKTKALKDDLDERAAQHRAPQVIFALALTALVMGFVIDAFRLKFLAAVFPISAGLLTMTLLVLLIMKMRSAQGVSNVLVDTELADTQSGVQPFRQIALFMLGIPILTALLGFGLAVPAFTVMLLRLKACMTWRFCFLYALAAFALFWGLGEVLSLTYPEGLLQYGLERL